MRRSTSASRVYAVLIAALSAYIGYGMALAQNRVDSGVAIEAGYGQSDNLTRELGDRSAFRYAGLTLDLESARPRLKGAISGNVQLRQYADEVPSPNEEDEVLGSLDGYARVQIVPGRFTWNFDANTGQARSDPRRVSSPQNREQVRILSTGPSVSIPVGRRAAVNFDASVAQRRFEETNRADSEAAQVGISVIRALSAVSQVALVVSRNDVEYDEAGVGYVFETAFLSYQRSFSSGGVELGFGGSKVHGPGIDSSAPVTRLSWSREVGTRSSLSFWIARELTDPGEVFRTGGVSGLVGEDVPGAPLTNTDIRDSRIDDVVLSSRPEKRTSAGVSVGVRGRKASFLFTAGASKDEFQGESAGEEGSDSDSRYAETSLSRQIARRWNAFTSLRVTRRDFDAEGATEELRGVLSASRDIARRGNIGLTFERNVRSGNIDVSDENTYVVSLSYAVVQ